MEAAAQSVTNAGASAGGRPSGSRQRNGGAVVAKNGASDAETNTGAETRADTDIGTGSSADTNSARHGAATAS